jgi:hypothetical protein
MRGSNRPDELRSKEWWGGRAIQGKSPCGGPRAGERGGGGGIRRASRSNGRAWYGWPARAKPWAYVVARSAWRWPSRGRGMGDVDVGAATPDVSWPPWRRVAWITGR